MASSDEALAALLNQGVSGADLGALDAFKSSIQAESPYRTAAAPILGAKFDMGTWSPATRFGVSAGQSFIGALLGEIAKKDEAEQLAKVTAVLPQLYSNPAAVAAPGGVDAGAFEILRQNAVAKRDIGKAVQASDFLKDMLKAQNAGIEARSKVFGELGAKKDFYGAGQDPDSPQFKLNKVIKDEEDARRTEVLAKVPGAQSLSVMTSVLPTLEAMSKINSKTSDIPFVYKLIQAQDGGVVKDGERDMVIASTPLLVKWKTELDGALNGGGLPVELKKQIVAEMKSNALATYETVMKGAEPIYQIGEKRGAARQNMSPFNDSYILESLTPKTETIDRATLQAEAAALRAANPSITKEQIAAQLRAKHGGTK
jgi:hypothetical protein